MMARMHQPAADPRSTRERSVPVLVVILGLSALLAVLVTAFAWPASNSEPRSVPIVVAGPDEIAVPITERLAQEQPGTFEVTTAADRDSAVRLIETREVYGALVAAPGGLEMLTASAASPAVHQLLSGLAAGIGASSEAPITVTDVVPTTAEDPRGAGLAAGSLPLVLAGIATAAALTANTRATGRRLVGVLGVALVGGPTMGAVLQLWLESLGGNYWANSAVFTLGIATIATALLGLASILGSKGLALGAATMVLLGNPLSGMSSAPEFLPDGWGALGQLLPPGALGTVLRSVAFFDGAGSSRAIVVLTSWLGLGLMVCLIGAWQNTMRTERVASAHQNGRTRKEVTT